MHYLSMCVRRTHTHYIFRLHYVEPRIRERNLKSQWGCLRDLRLWIDVLTKLKRRINKLNRLGVRRTSARMKREELTETVPSTRFNLRIRHTCEYNRIRKNEETSVREYYQKEKANTTNYKYKYQLICKHMR